MAVQGFLAPPLTWAETAEFTTDGMAWAPAKELAQGAGGPCWANQSILRLLNIFEVLGQGAPLGSR